MTAPLDPGWETQATPVWASLDAFLADIGPRKDGEASPTLPHESDQQPGSQSPAADQDKTPEAKDAYRDAKLGRPDTSSAPLLQQPSPQDKSG